VRAGGSPRVSEPPLPGLREPGPEYHLLETKTVFAGRIFRVVQKRMRLPNGHLTEHEVIQHPGAVSIIPLLEETPGRPELVLVEQFRSSVEGYMHEIPAGTLSPGEDPLACAQRELLEETGYSAERWTHLATIYPTPGIAAERMHYYLAEELRLTAAQKLDPGECLSVKRFPLEGLLESMVHRRPVPGIPPVVDGKTLIGVFYLGALRGGRAGPAKREENRR
jgi:ADP-ribose pyrophosphatase